MERSKQALIAGKLRDLLSGDIYTDDKALKKFSRDQSIYDVRPLAVVEPENLEDLRKLILFAASEGVSITPRGGGSGTAGSALGEGIVVALPPAKGFDQITGFRKDHDTAQVRVGAGVYHQKLQDFLRERGFFLPADVSSAGISQIGGNIATKASGPHALKYGSMNKFLKDVEFLTARGERVDTSDERTIPDRFKNGLNGLKQKIRGDDAARSKLEARQDMKIASGYNLFAFLNNYSPATLLSQLFAGSVGTFGLITGATIVAQRRSPERGAMILYFEELAEAGRAVTCLRSTEVAAIEIMNKETLRLIQERGVETKEIRVEAHVLLLEFEGKGQTQAIESVKRILRSEGFRFSREPAVATTNERIEELWKVRKGILPLIRNPGPKMEALSIVNDVGVDPIYLADFIEDLEKVFKEHGLETVIYGHAGSGNLHLRPLFDLEKPDLKGRIRRLADDVYEVVFHYGGTITAEHGMGRLRAPYLRREWGETLYAAMKELKSFMDPDGIFNPDAVFNERPITDHMRGELLYTYRLH
jgi:FAD/FMN-containing dehydrogenase